MDSRRSLVIIAAAALTLAACSSTTSGKPDATSKASSGTSSPAGSTSSSSSGTASSGSTAPGSGSATNPEALAALLQRGLESTRSAHIDLRVTTAGKTITGSGDERLVAGKLSALSLTETLPGVGDLQIIEVNGKTYAKLPGQLNTSGKPFVLVTTSSTNPTIKSLATTLASSQSSASIGSAGVFASAASSIKLVGPTTVGATKATHYSVVVDVSKLPSDYPGKAALLQSGLTTLPVELYVDSEGRPVQVTESLTVSGTSVATRFVVSSYNKPVTITAPPASQVSTK